MKNYLNMDIKLYNMLARYPARLIKISEINNSEYIKPEEEAGYLDFNGLKIYRVLVYGVVINKMESDVSQTITIDDGTGNIDIRSFDKIDDFESIDIGDIVMVVGRIREFGRKYVLYEMIRKLDQVKWFEFFELLRELVDKLNLLNSSDNTLGSNLTQIQDENNIKNNMIKNEVTTENHNTSQSKLNQQSMMSNINNVNDNNINEIDVSAISNSTNEQTMNEEKKDTLLSDQLNTQQNEITEINVNNINNEINNERNQTNEFIMKQLQRIEEESDNISKLLKIIEMLDTGDGADYDEIQQHYNHDDLDDMLMRLLESGDIYEFRPRRYKIL